MPDVMDVKIVLFPETMVAAVEHRGPPFLYREWLPQSGERLGDFPIFFHYVNVGPEVKEHDMITDVYLPLKG